jgi:DNA-binding protein HU-beta
MNKAELINAISSGSTLTKAEAGKALASLTESIGKALKKGERVSFPGFGTFTIAQRQARTGRNPRTGAAINIKAKKVVKFKPSSKLEF